MRRKTGRLTKNLMALSVVPLLAFCLIVLVLSSSIIYNGLRNELAHSLQVLDRSSYRTLGYLYPGGYSVKDGMLFKGGHPLSGRTDLMDNIKELSGDDATLFLHDTRFLTTIRNENGTRAVGTRVAEDVAESVLIRGEDYFSTQVPVNGIPYFGYYMPLRSTGGEIVGMLFVGRPRSGVIAQITKNILLVCVTELCIMLVVVAVVLLYSKKLISSLEKTEKFLGDIARGNLTAQLDPLLLDRQDEIGEMGRFAVVLRDSIAGQVGKDPLTGLYNRRCCDAVLQNLAEDCQRKGSTFTIAMGDIDFFKRVNDCYGHQAGDEILRKIAGDISARMEHLGFVFRWGGEEFLLVYENMNRETAMAHVEQLKENLSVTDMIWNGDHIRVTMTFGVAEYAEEHDIEKLIQLTDTNLYLGKSKGRNRVVCTQCPKAGA